MLDVERVAGDVVEGLDGDGERVVVDGSTVRETSQKRPNVGASCWRRRSGASDLSSARLRLSVHHLRLLSKYSLHAFDPLVHPASALKSHSRWRSRTW